MASLVERFFAPIEELSNTEAMVGEGFWRVDIKPMEAISYEAVVFDATSLHIQRALGRLGFRIPDVRSRILVNPTTDGLHGIHYGTLDGAIKKAWQIQQQLENRDREWENGWRQKLEENQISNSRK